MLNKFCNCCLLLKNIEEFAFKDKRRTQKQSQCKRCKIKKQKYRPRYDRDKIYYQNNKEIIKTKNRLYKINNRKKYNENYNLRCKKDHFFRLKINIRNRLREFLKSKNMKNYSISIGCDKETLYKHLESKFTEGMEWGNYGKWHVDHIIPLSSAKTKEEMYKLCHYTNLQPLWAKDNLKKGSKILIPPTPSPYEE